MSKFKEGDRVYGGDWCYGEIIQLDKYGAWIEFDTGTGGGTSYFDYDDIRLVED